MELLTHELGKYLSRADRLAKLKIEYQGLSSEHAEHEAAIYGRLSALGKPVDSHGMLWQARGSKLITTELLYGHEADELDRQRHEPSEPEFCACGQPATVRRPTLRGGMEDICEACAATPADAYPSEAAC